MIFYCADPRQHRIYVSDVIKKQNVVSIDIPLASVLPRQYNYARTTQNNLGLGLGVRDFSLPFKHHVFSDHKILNVSIPAR